MGHIFSSKEQASFNFMAAVTICSDFGASPHPPQKWPSFQSNFTLLATHPLLSSTGYIHKGV